MYFFKKKLLFSFLPNFSLISTSFKEHIYNISKIKICQADVFNEDNLKFLL